MALSEIAGTASHVGGFAETRGAVSGAGGNVHGGMEQSFALLRRRSASRYSVALAFPATSYELVPRAGTLSDVRLVGVRPCAGVWRWDGSSYEHLRNDPLQPGGCSDGQSAFISSDADIYTNAEASHARI